MHAGDSKFDEHPNGTDRLEGTGFEFLTRTEARAKSEELDLPE